MHLIDYREAGWACRCCGDPIRDCNQFGYCCKRACKRAAYAQCPEYRAVRRADGLRSRNRKAKRPLPTGQELPHD